MQGWCVGPHWQGVNKGTENAQSLLQLGAGRCQEFVQEGARAPRHLRVLEVLLLSIHQKAAYDKSSVSTACFRVESLDGSPEGLGGTHFGSLAGLMESNP